MAMLRYTALRLFWIFPVLLGIGTITFVLMHAVPGGPWDENKKLPPQVVANLNHRYGLDDPLWAQANSWVVPYRVILASRTPTKTGMLPR